MNTHINYELGGSFKCDLYNKDGFVSSTDWFNNFITPTGLMMPLNYAFADCFRYLSLGSAVGVSSGTKSLLGLGTTGLIIPHVTYEVSSGPVQKGQYIDWRAYATGTSVSQSSCGTLIDLSGPRLYRAWRIPSGGDDVFIQNTTAGGLTIGELMVSPSSGTDPVGKCAFSRVQRNLFIPNGYSTIIYYQLRINLRNTGVTIFSGGTFATGNAEVSSDAGLIAEWANLSGYYRQVYNGLRYIDSYGATYIPKYGDCLEPSSRSLSKALWYLSPDNSQFDVSVSGGQPQTIAQSYKADGLSKSITSLETTDLNVYNINATTSQAAKQEIFNADDLSTPTSYPSTSPAGVVEYNLRVGKDGGARCVVPVINNYLDVGQELNYQSAQTPSSYKVSYATPGTQGFSDSYSDFGKKMVITSQVTKIPILLTGQNLVTGRKKTVNRKSVFSPISSLGYNTRFGSLVFAYDASNAGIVAPSKTYYPMIDCLFYDSSGRSLMPHYRFITGLHLSERGTGIIGCSLYLTGNNTGNIYQYLPYTTFRGDSLSLSSHPLASSVAWNGAGGATKYSGFTTAGAINLGITGTTGVLTNLSGLGSSVLTSYTGWGAIYGTVVNSGFYDLKYDIGLADHSLSALTEPTSTGQLYWNTINEVGKISLNYSGLKYYHPDLGFVFDDTGWFSPTQQVIKKIDFELIESGGTWGKVITNSVNPGFVKNVSGLSNEPNYVGYFLTTKQFTGTIVTPSTDVCVGSTDNITGYIVYDDPSNSKLRGTVWNDVSLPSAKFQFNPLISGYTLNGTPGCRKVYSLFTGLTDRGYTGGALGVAPFTGIALSAQQIVNVVFTGISGGSKPIYLTHISGQSATANLTGYSLMSGIVYSTNFCAPKGYPSHAESSGQGSAYGWRLAPNFIQPNYYGSDNTATPNFGGAYPALSLDNGLEMYLTLSWQSSCGNGVDLATCNEPE